MNTGSQRLSLELPSESEWTPEQRSAADLIASGPRGALLGPFVPLLHSPELMTRVQLVGEYLRFEKTLEDDLFEMIVLTVARHWNQEFEWGFHQPLAVQAGIPKSVIGEIAEGRMPTSGRPDLAGVWNGVQALLRSGRWGERTYSDLGFLGARNALELIATVGYYTTLAFTMNVAKTRVPSGLPPLRQYRSECGGAL